MVRNLSFENRVRENYVLLVVCAEAGRCLQTGLASISLQFVCQNTSFHFSS